MRYERVADRPVFQRRVAGSPPGGHRSENVDMSNVYLRMNRRSRKSQDSFALKNSEGLVGP